MHCTRKLNDSISWVGGNDRRLALFENLFPIPRGVSYNSYLITDEKTDLIDTVDASISHQFLENIYSVLDGRSLDYLVINHMEPDHCANIEELLLRFPDLKIVGNAKTLTFAKQFYDMDMEGMDCCQNDCANCLASCQHMMFGTPLRFSSTNFKEAIQLNSSEPLVQSPTSPFRPPIAA